jgi:MFS family permease
VTPLKLYLVGTGAWFLAFGIQSVMFSWLVTIVLHESPQKVGVAQMSLLVPATLLLLVGGSLADHFGGRRIAALAQSAAMLPPLFLIVVLAAQSLTFDAMIVYGVAMGIAQAFVTPGRDSLLNEVAEGSIQRTVVMTSFVQFGAQMIGFLLASLANVHTALFIVSIQAIVLGIGALAFRRVEPRLRRHAADHHPLKDLVTSVTAGARSVFASRPMRVIVAQNVAMGICFMGSYIVTIPLLVREVYHGAAADLAALNAANAFGLLTSIMVLMRRPDIARPGRALLLSQGIGAVALAATGSGFGFPFAIGCIYFWGICGGVAMSMSRTIMQEQAPPDQRGRIMSFFAFSFMGAGPIGALVAGYEVRWVGAEVALVVASSAMLAVIVAVAWFSSLWRLTPRSAEH